MMNDNKYAQSKALLERSEKVLAGGVSSEFRKYGYPHALFYTHGAGTKVFDVDGNEYLDFTLSQGPLLLGHSHPQVLQAVQEASQKAQLFAGQHMQELELAEKLQKIIPSAEMIRFCLDGSEAVHTAFRVARAKTGRPKFLRFEGHYHGWLDNVSWGISTPSLQEMGSRQDPAVHPWSSGLPARARDEFMVLPWNDLELVEKTLELHHGEIAAVITEPVMCNNACIIPKEGFLQGLRALCDRYGIALIFDEVITGFRLSLGGAQQYFGVIPDLAIFAKALGSGYPISAIVGKRAWMQEIAESRVIHAGTMNSGNPTVAAALATVSILDAENPYSKLFALGEQLREGLKDLAQETGQNLIVQGIGPVVYTGFSPSSSATDYRDTLSHDKTKLKAFVGGLHDLGIRVIGRGLWYLSTAHQEKDIEAALSAAGQVLANLKKN